MRRIVLAAGAVLVAAVVSAAAPCQAAPAPVGVSAATFGTPPPPPPPPPGGSLPPPPPVGDPAAAFGADAPPHYAGQRVRFDAVTFGASSYTWTVGDGGKAKTTVPLAYHPFATAGTYTVVLVLKQPDGSEPQASLQVTVEGPKLSGAKLPS